MLKDLLSRECASVVGFCAVEPSRPPLGFSRAGGGRESRSAGFGDGRL